MKTKNLLLAGLFICSVSTVTAQVTEDTNTVSNSSSYVGTYNDFDVLFKRGNLDAGLLSATKTSFGIGSYAYPYSVSIGDGAGKFYANTLSVGNNTFVGWSAGSGTSALDLNSGRFNSYFGSYAGHNCDGESNLYLGVGSGVESTGDNNIFMGVSVGWASSGNGNILIGNGTGAYQTGSNNIILGLIPNGPVSRDNQLFIENGWDDYAPLIWGDFDADQIKLNGKVGVGYGFGSYPTDAGGVDVSAYNLFVKGGILTEAVRVSLESAWADYVFEKNYDLKPLSEVEQFIIDNGHLPNVPSAKQVKEQGIDLGEMAKIQQEKIEELTLYIIELNKKLEAQEKKIEALIQAKQ